MNYSTAGNQSNIGLGSGVQGSTLSDELISRADGPSQEVMGEAWEEPAPRRQMAQYAVDAASDNVMAMPQETTVSPRNGIRTINIEGLSFGYVVKVGCQSFAIESADKVTKFLNQYMKDPHETERLWFDGKLDLK